LKYFTVIKSTDQTASPGGEATTLGGGTAVSDGGTPDTGCGTPFRLSLITALVTLCGYRFMHKRGEQI